MSCPKCDGDPGFDGKEVNKRIEDALKAMEDVEEDDPNQVMKSKKTPKVYSPNWYKRYKSKKLDTQLFPGRKPLYHE
jgi:hypothetical protein